MDVQGDIVPKMRDCAYHVFRSVQHKLTFPARQLTFELFGLDFMIDANQQVTPTLLAPPFLFPPLPSCSQCCLLCPWSSELSRLLLVALCPNLMHMTANFAPAVSSCQCERKPATRFILNCDVLIDVVRYWLQGQPHPQQAIMSQRVRMWLSSWSISNTFKNVGKLRRTCAYVRSCAYLR